MFDAAERWDAIYLNVRSGCVMVTVVSKKTQNISVLIREFEGTKTCNATNVPQEGRPLGKMLLLLFVRKLDVECVLSGISPGASLLVSRPV